MSTADVDFVVISISCRKIIVRHKEIYVLLIVFFFILDQESNIIEPLSTNLNSIEQ